MEHDGESRSSNNRAGFSVGLFEPERASGITDLFKAVYGDAYPIRIFYSPEEIIRANRAGDYISVTAHTDDGKVVGVEHLFRSAPNPHLYEWGVGLTLKEFRGKGVFGEIGRFVVEEAIPKLGIEAVFGESVCNHLHTQKMTARNGSFDAAIEVALMPAETYAREDGPQSRVATVLQFRTFKKYHHTVFIPEVYHEQLEFAYAALDDERDFTPSGGSFDPDALCKSEQKIFDFAGVSRVAFHELGADFDGKMWESEEQARRSNVKVFQVWLPLGSPVVAEAVEICRFRGYFFGGPLMRWFGEDGFLMQKLECNPDFEYIRLLSDRAKTLLEMIRGDWDHSRKRAGGTQ